MFGTFWWCDFACVSEMSLGKEVCDFWVPGEWIKVARGCVNLGSVSHFFKRGDGWELYDE